MATTKKRAARRASKSTTTTSTSAASADGATLPTRRRGPATHSQIRLTLDVAGVNGAPAKSLAETIAQLTPSQREGLVSAGKSGNGWRLVVVFTPSETRDIDESIRALPAGLQASVTGAEKL